MQNATKNPIDAIFTSKNTLNTMTENVNRITNRMREIDALLTSQPTPTPKPKRTWWNNNNNNKTYVDSDWYTSATERNMATWWAEFGGGNSTIKKLDEQEMAANWLTPQQIQMYQADNEWYYQKRRNETIWANWATRDDVFNSAVEKFLANPDSFNQQQRDLLIKAGNSLWYDMWKTMWQNSTTTSTTQTAAPTVQPTVQPTITNPAPTQRKINNANDAYYAPQNAWRDIIL